MSRQNLVRFNAAGREPLTPFVVKQGTSYQIPDSKQKASAVDSAFGGSNLASVVPVVGGQLLVAMNDGAAGTANVFDLTMHDVCDLRPGDTVAISAVASNAATLSVTSVDGTVRSFVITGITTVAQAVGYYG